MCILPVSHDTTVCLIDIVIFITSNAGTVFNPVNLGFFFFFFQAEDGIRDYKVTGVQTCALPISCSSSSGNRSVQPASIEGRNLFRPSMEIGHFLVPLSYTLSHTLSAPSCGHCRWRRSEERRVGKECRGDCWRLLCDEKQCRELAR